MTESLIASLAERPRASVVRALPTQVLTEQYNRWSEDLAARIAGADKRPTFGLRRSLEDPKFMVDHASGMGRALNDMLLLGLGGVIHLAVALYRGRLDRGGRRVQTLRW